MLPRVISTVVLVIMGSPVSTRSILATRRRVMCDFRSLWCDSAIRGWREGIRNKAPVLKMSDKRFPLHSLREHLALSPAGCRVVALDVQPPMLRTLNSLRPVALASL